MASPRVTAAASGADPDSVAAVQQMLDEHDYLAGEGLATAIFLALRLRRPLFLEGEPGVGKTEVAKVLARATGGELVRLQCYEGIDATQALYEWDHARQLLHLRVAEATGALADGAEAVEADLYDERFLIRRPLLQALDRPVGAARPVLLVDELDRADDEFEAFLLEILAESAVTVPELGTIRATDPPVVVITSNRTRDVHDALKRRCLYHWVEHPDLAQEIAIVRRRVPGVGERLATEVAGAAAELRARGLYKPPGVAETIDWAQALEVLGRSSLDDASVDATLGLVVKHREDLERVRALDVGTLVAAALARTQAAS